MDGSVWLPGSLLKQNTLCFCNKIRNSVKNAMTLLNVLVHFVFPLVILSSYRSNLWFFFFSKSGSCGTDNRWLPDVSSFFLPSLCLLSSFVSEFPHSLWVSSYGGQEFEMCLFQDSKFFKSVPSFFANPSDTQGRH